MHAADLQDLKLPCSCRARDREAAKSSRLTEGWTREAVPVAARSANLQRRRTTFTRLPADSHTSVRLASPHIQKNGLHPVHNQSRHPQRSTPCDHCLRPPYRRPPTCPWLYLLPRLRHLARRPQLIINDTHPATGASSTSCAAPCLPTRPRHAPSSAEQQRPRRQRTAASSVPRQPRRRHELTCPRPLTSSLPWKDSSEGCRRSDAAIDGPRLPAPTLFDAETRLVSPDGMCRRWDQQQMTVRCSLDERITSSQRGRSSATSRASERAQKANFAARREGGGCPTASDVPRPQSGRSAGYLSALKRGTWDR